jgi:hypothetical protein
MYFYLSIFLILKIIVCQQVTIYLNSYIDMLFSHSGKKYRPSQMGCAMWCDTGQHRKARVFNINLISKSYQNDNT